MKFPWFRRSGIFFLPRSVAGWTIFSLALAAAIVVFVRADTYSHSASDTLRIFFICLLGIFAIYTLVASLTSRDSSS